MSARADAPNPIAARENVLRDWLFRDQDPELRTINGHDIGWGGVTWLSAKRLSPAVD
jgi:hypothetical protein